MIRPGPGVATAAVVGVPAAERGQKRLGHDLLGQRRAQPGVRVAQNLGGVPIVDGPKPSRFLPRQFDEVGVAVRAGRVRRPDLPAQHVPRPYIAGASLG